MVFIGFPSTCYIKEREEMKMKRPDILFKPYELPPYAFPAGFKIIQDTREQLPLFTASTTPPGLTVITTTVKDGDYTIKGFESSFAIERKQISDFFSYIGKERTRTTEKMKRFKQFKWVGLVIEESESKLLSGHFFSTLSPEVVRQSIVSFEVRSGVHVFYSENRADIQRWILDRAIKFYKLMREGDVL
jgi:DNA excision repair protein ERCC-4